MPKGIFVVFGGAGLWEMGYQNKKKLPKKGAIGWTVCKSISESLRKSPRLTLLKKYTYTFSGKPLGVLVAFLFALVKGYF